VEVCILRASSAVMVPFFLTKYADELLMGSPHLQKPILRICCTEPLLIEVTSAPSVILLVATLIGDSSRAATRTVEI